MKAGYRIYVRDNPISGLEQFSLSQLNAIAESLAVELQPGVKLVHYGENPPSDTSLPWQQTLADGVTPVGIVKHFVAGRWM